MGYISYVYIHTTAQMYMESIMSDLMGDGR